MARFTRRRVRRRSTYRKKTRRIRRRTMRKRGRGIKGSLNTHRYVRSQEQTVYNKWNPLALPSATNEVAIDNNPIFELPLQTNNGTSQPYPGFVNLVSDCQFQLSKTDGYTEFEALYDQYKIEKVVLKFEYKHNSSQVGAAFNTGAPTPTIFYFEDHDDATNTNFNDWKQRAAYSRKWNLSTPFVYTVKNPTVLMDVLRESTVSSSVVKRAPWIDCGITNVNHYGFKFLIQDWPLWAQSNTADEMFMPILRVTARYYLRFRNVR